MNNSAQYWFRKDKRNALIKKYCMIVATIVGAFLVFFAAGTGIYLKTHANALYDSEKQIERNLGVFDAKEETVTDKESIISVPDKTNFLVVGVDGDEVLTDTIMVMGYDSKLNKISVVSIPRDTYVTLSDDKIRAIQAEKRIVPANGVMKINEINSYAGKKYGIPCLKEEIEEILGINLHYYIKINTKGFREVVDTVGGIEFEVPAGGLYYNDPTQNLNINLKGGLQTLNGKDAEGLVRFRSGYASADLKRMEVQQQFLKEFVKQVMNKETLVDNAAKLIYDFLSYVETDFKVTDAAKYIPMINKIDPNNIWTTTLPGEARYVNESSYYFYDKGQTRRLVAEFFYSKTLNDADSETGRDESSPFIKEYKTPVVIYNNANSSPSNSAGGDNRNANDNQPEEGSQETKSDNNTAQAEETSDGSDETGEGEDSLDELTSDEDELAEDGLTEDEFLGENLIEDELSDAIDEYEVPDAFADTSILENAGMNEEIITSEQEIQPAPLP